MEVDAHNSTSWKTPLNGKMKKERWRGDTLWNPPGYLLSIVRVFPSLSAATDLVQPWAI
jgi:hypothetical protein